MFESTFPHSRAGRKEQEVERDRFIDKIDQTILCINTSESNLSEISYKYKVLNKIIAKLFAKHI